VRRLSAVIGTGIFLLLAPGIIAGAVPWWISRWHMRPPLLGVGAVRVLGIILILEGVAVLLDSFARFAWQGLGTPAPVFPTRHLVVSGLYRYVRNPMYVGVLLANFGQGLLLGDTRLLVYGAVIWAAMHLFVITYEEPTLRRTFGAEYEAFCANVPRWIPRMRPWSGRS
jgi:protein-S-isoprenylcysteine O-methyltransferase Ste14